MNGKLMPVDYGMHTLDEITMAAAVCAACEGKWDGLVYDYSSGRFYHRECIR